MFYLGIDWADEYHNVYVTDDTAQTLDSFQIKHNYDGLQLLKSKMEKLTSDKTQVLFAMEKPHGLLAGFILQKGYTLYPINPKAVDRYRDRYRSSGAKDDYFDAMVLANILRTDRTRFQPLLPDSSLVREIRTLVQDQDTFVRQLTRLTHQLEDSLKQYYPVAVDLFCALDQPITLDFLEAFPTPESAQKLTLEQFRAFLKSRHYRHLKRAAQLHNKLTNPQMPVEDWVIRAKAQQMISLVKQISPLLKSIAEYDRLVSELFQQHPDHEIYESLPEAGGRLAPRLLVVMGDRRERYPDFRSLQSTVGTAPITKSSGKYKHVQMRYGCIKSYRNTLYQFSFCSKNQSQWAKGYYDQQRVKGKTHSVVLRGLGNKWLKIIHRMWQTRAKYSEDYHLKQQVYYLERRKQLLTKTPLVKLAYA
jgi:transposase